MKRTVIVKPARSRRLLSEPQPSERWQMSVGVAARLSLLFWIVAVLLALQLKRAIFQ